MLFGDVKCIRSDKGIEFICSAFKPLLRNNHIMNETSAPHSPHKTGTVERHRRTYLRLVSAC